MVSQRQDDMNKCESEGKNRVRQREGERERAGRPVSIPEQTAVDNHGL